MLNANRIQFFLILISLYLLWPQLGYSYDSYEQNVTAWQEVSRPATSLSGSRMVWHNSANQSDYEWKVFKEGQVIKAVLDKYDEKRAQEKPPFSPQAENLKYFRASLKVDDGWLIGFNHGEFGAALYWFDPSGQKRHKISSHQVVAFFPSSNGILAIEGLAHLSFSYGSIIRITKQSQWQAQKVTLLPEAPRTGAEFKDGRLLLVLSDSLAEYFLKGEHERLKFLEKDGGWLGLYPNSVVLTDDETKAYIGMRQYVTEYDFKRRTLRFLIPDSTFLNKLPADEERSIRNAYGPP